MVVTLRKQEYEEWERDFIWPQSLPFIVMGSWGDRILLGIIGLLENEFQKWKSIDPLGFKKISKNY